MKHLKKAVKYGFSLSNVVSALLMFLASGILFVAIIYLVFVSTEKETKYKCNQYVEYSKTLTDFWISAQDKVDCDNVGITVNAPIH